jgi:alkylation response protein AidB-like acyl-CoA dehydrogenase
MDLSYDSEHTAFQAQVREFLAEHWDRKAARGDQRQARERVFRLAATQRGYLYRSIPKRYGGSEQTPDVISAQIIREEFARVGAPMELPGIGLMMVVPTLLEVGSESQRERFVRKTVEGEYRWAQGYSEPGSGSDLASLSSRAELVGDEWVINGHKIWTTMAHTATHMFALLRTEPDAPKHAGLSYILLDFKQRGVTVRPIKQISGSREFCEVFLEDVRTPADWIVGRRGEGWNVSRVNLKHERNAVGSSSRSLPTFEKLVALAKATRLNGRPAIEDPSIRRRLAAVEGHVMAQLWSGYHQLTLDARGESPGVLGLVNKITTTNIGQELALIATEVLAETTLLMPPEDTRKGGEEKWVNQIMGSLGLAIAGGTSNIQRNIISERGLGLPREAAEN